MWVRFTRDFDFDPPARGGLVTLAYKGGTVVNVTRECARLAKAAGAAVSAKSPRHETNGEEVRGG